MQNIPMFTSEYGIAGLTLNQIPSRGNAFISYGTSEEPEKLLQECVSFCRTCGADRIYASGFPNLEETYPLHTRILQLQMLRESLSGETAQLWPVLPENAEKWRAIYNEKMETVDHAAYIDFFDMKQHVKAGDCYFIHRNGQLLGIGKASGNTLHALAGLQTGAGETIVRTLSTLLSEETVHLEVASTNRRALALYERLGFLVLGEKESWYQII